MFLSFVFVVAGLAMVAVGSNWLVDGASALAQRLRISDLIIGLTIVAFGTSAPELAVNLFASGSGNTDLAIGNILGSSIFNILVILGISAIVYPIAVQSSTVWIEIPLCVLAALLAGICANDVWIDNAATSQVTRSDGLFLLGFFLVFLYYTFYVSKKNPEPILTETHTLMPVWKAILLLVVGLAGLVLGGKLVVDGAVDIASQMGISQSIIGLTIVAAGTSIPELATSIAAAIKKKPDLAVGNVVGSNIFNTFLVLGTSSTVQPLPFNPANNLDVMINIIASILLFIFAYTGKRTITRIEGGVLFAVYLCYTAYLVSTI